LFAFRVKAAFARQNSRDSELVGVLVLISVVNYVYLILHNDLGVVTLSRLNRAVTGLVLEIRARSDLILVDRILHDIFNALSVRLRG
jgi:hypothetical protein